MCVGRAYAVFVENWLLVLRRCTCPPAPPYTWGVVWLEPIQRFNEVWPTHLPPKLLLHLRVRHGGPGVAGHRLVLRHLVHVACVQVRYRGPDGLREGNREQSGSKLTAHVAKRKRAPKASPEEELHLVLLLWLSIPSRFLVVFEKPNRSSFTFTFARGDKGHAQQHT